MQAPTTSQWPMGSFSHVIYLFILVENVMCSWALTLISIGPAFFRDDMYDHISIRNIASS